MSIKQSLTSLQDKFMQKADVQFVFGNPFEAKGKTIIPVSAVKCSIGGGEGKGPDLSKIKGVAKDEAEGEQKENRPAGEGVGGRFSNHPLGIFEIKAESTRFIPVVPLKQILTALSIWIVLKALKRKKK